MIYTFVNGTVCNNFLINKACIEVLNVFLLFLLFLVFICMFIAFIKWILISLCVNVNTYLVRV